MDYFSTKFGFAITMKEQMSKEQFEFEFDGSIKKYMNYMLCGNQNIQMPENFLLGEKPDSDLIDE